MTDAQKNTRRTIDTTFMQKLQDRLYIIANVKLHCYNEIKTRL